MLESSKKQEEDIAEEFLTQYKFAVEELERKSGYVPSKTISPSSIKCIRTATFKRLGASRDSKSESEQLISICQNGSSEHENTQRVISKMSKLGLKFEAVNIGDYIREHNVPITIKKESNFDKGEYETKLFSDDYFVSFLADGMVKYKGKYYLIEIKTQPFESQMRQNDVHEKHKDQATAYCVLLGIDSVIFFYEERNFLGKKCFLFTPTEEQKKNMLDKIILINKYAVSRTIPAKPQEASENRNFCKYCDYISLCNLCGDSECKYEEN